MPIKIGKVVVDRDRRLAFGSSGSGLLAISLKDLRPGLDPLAMGLRDKNGDGIDDRLLYTIPDTSVMDIVMDYNKDGKLIAYTADYVNGKMRIIHLGNGLEIRLYKMDGVTEFKTNEILITNDENGNPKMPEFIAKVFYEGKPVASDQKVCWNIKVEYLVDTTAAPQRSRKGLNKNEGPAKGEDGFVLPWSGDCIIGKDEAGKSKQGQAIEISSNTTSGINWNNKFGGGILTITAEVDNNGSKVSSKYAGKIQGQMFNDDDDKFKSWILNYLENPESTEAQDITATLKYSSVFRIIAYLESRYKHFVPSFAGKPTDAIYPIENGNAKIGSDGGFGLMQLTYSDTFPWLYEWTVNNKKKRQRLPSYEQIWHYKKNIDGGIGVVKEKLRMATAWHNKYPVADNEKAEFLRWDVYQLYNTGHFWEWLEDRREDGGDGKMKWIGERYVIVVDDNGEEIEKERYGSKAIEIEEQLAIGEIPSEY